MAPSTETRHRTHETLELVASHVAVAVNRCSRDFRYVWVNREYAAWLQRSADEMVGRPIVDIIGPDAFEAKRPYFARVLAGERVSYEEEVPFRDIGTRWISAAYAPTRDADGQVDGWVAIVVDITHRKRAEQQLQESEERFRLLANAAPVMIWLSDTDRACTYVNQSWLAFTGRSLQEELGDGWANGIHADDVQGCLRMLEKAFERREPFELEYRLRRHDGVYCWILDHGVPRFAADGAFVGYIGSGIDVSERRLAEEALSSVSRRLIEAHEAERTWVARELHDHINQGLALLAMNLETMQRKVPGPLPELERQVAEARAMVSELIGDVRAMSQRLHSAKLDLLGLETAARAFCRELSERHGVEVDFHAKSLPDELPQDVALCLFRVLQEALQNAVKHSGVRRFRVSLQGGATAVELSVNDSGIGFSHAEAIRGRGLGLTSMKERLKLVNGELFIDSQLRHGTTIRARVGVSRSLC